MANGGFTELEGPIGSKPHSKDTCIGRRLSNFVDSQKPSRLDPGMGKPPQIKTIIALLLSTAFATKLFGADPTPSGSSKEPTRSTVTTCTNAPPLYFRKATKPPFPWWLKREVLATRNLQYNAIVKVTIDHGKIVSVVPCGGNEALADHLASAVQKTWVADPRMNGTFTLPIKFQLQGH